MKIMTVDDSMYERKLIISMLKNNGYKNVIEAGSGEDAIEEYKKHKPDLILMDIRMQKMDGIECFKELKKIKNDVKVIFLTIILQEKTLAETKKLGALNYLVKPITEEKLLEAVSKVK